MVKQKSFKAIIFDMDGVLLNTEPHHIKIEKNLFAGLGLVISDEEHRTFLGKSSLQMWKEMKSKYGLSKSEDELAKINNDEIVRYFTEMNEIELMPGVKEILKIIHDKNIPVALASSSDIITIDILLSRAGIKDYFLHLVSSETVGKSKPEPDIYLHTARLLSVSPGECVVIEDSPNGIKAAKSAGMYCIAYSGNTSEDIDQSLADMSIDDFSQLEEVVMRIGGRD